MPHDIFAKLSNSRRPRTNLDLNSDSLFGPEGRTKRALLGSQETDRFPVKLKIGSYEQKLGWLAYVEKGFQMLYIYVGAGELKT